MGETGFREEALPFAVIWLELGVGMVVEEGGHGDLSPFRHGTIGGTNNFGVSVVS
jgi:hypothetical protein